MTAYAYCRVSTIQQSESGDSLETQEKRIAAYCEQEGVPLTKVFIERAVSGGRRFCERPEGGQLLSRVQDGDVIVAAKLDRCFRSASDALEVLDSLKQRHVDLVLLDLGGSVTSGGMGGLIFTVMAAIASFEKDRIGERIAEVKAMGKSQGKFLGGRRPFGFQIGDSKQLVPDPSEQAAMSLILKFAAEGLSLRRTQSAIAEALGIKMSHTAIQRVLRDARVTTGEPIP